MGYLDFSGMRPRAGDQALRRVPQFMQNIASGATGWRHWGHVPGVVGGGLGGGAGVGSGAGGVHGEGAGGGATIIGIPYAGQAGIVAWT